MWAHHISLRSIGRWDARRFQSVKGSATVGLLLDYINEYGTSHQQAIRLQSSNVTLIVFHFFKINFLIHLHALKTNK